MSGTGGGVDTSIYGNLQQPNSVAALGQFASFQNAMNQNRLFQQTMRARMALGPILQKSVDPSTGQPDFSKAALMAAQNPDTAFMAPDFMDKAVNMQGVQMDNQLKQWELVQKEQTAFGNAAASLGNLGDNVTRADVGKKLGSLAQDMDAAGIGGPKLYERLIQFQAGLPEDGPKLKTFLQQVGLQASGAADSLNKTIGTLQPVDTGTHTQFYAVSPLNGEARPIGQPIPKQPSLADQNALVPTKVQSGPNAGAEVSVPRFQAAPMAGLGSPEAAPQSAGQQQAAPPAPAGASAGPPAAGTSPGQQAAGGAASPPAQGPAVPAGAVTGLAPQQEEYLKGRATNMVDYEKNLNTQSTAAQNAVLKFSRMQQLATQFKPGAGNTEYAKAAGLAQAFGMPKALVDGIAGGSLSAMQQFNKLAAQNTAESLRQSLGNTRLTNMEFGVFNKANPNIDTDPRAVPKLLAFTKAVSELTLKEQKAFALWKQAAAEGKTNPRTGQVYDPADFPEAWVQKLQSNGTLAALGKMGEN